MANPQRKLRSYEPPGERRDEVESGADAIGERIAPPIRSYSVQIPAVPVTGWRDYLRSALVGLAQLGAIAAAVHFAGVRATIAGFAILAVLLVAWGNYVLNNTIEL